MLLHESVFEHARSRPDAPAVVCGAERLSYRDLDQRANVVANALQERGTRPGRLVGICAHRGIDGLIGLLGILKSGCAYVPLDPDYPRERLDFMVRDSEIDTVVVDVPQTARQLPAVGVVAVCDTPGRLDQPPEALVSADDLCYVIYTSGSMGRPKGSMNAHGGVINTLRGLVEVLPVADGFRIALISSLNYDMSVFEVFGTWLLGGCVVVPQPDEVNDPDRLITMLHDQQVQMWNSAPALFDLVLQRALATGRALPDSLRVVALGGDRFPPDVIGLARAVAPAAQLFNLAGLTETSYCSTWYRVRPEDAEGAIPWGYPLPGQQLYVLDDRLSPVPDGELGEMCIGGPGVGRGYWRRPELTALRFVPDPFGRSADARMFRTGDQVRRRADGCLEFHGRLDDQIKVRGLRIEPGEIERVVETHPAVVRAVAVVDVNTAELRCYYVAKDDARVPDEELRDLTRRYLAAHMVPARFVRLAELPLLPSGKIDRGALAASNVVDAEVEVDASSEGQTSGDPAERLVLAVYREMVGEAAIGDNFFDAGGNSLQATQFVMRVRDELDIDLPMRSLLEARTLAEFAAALDAAARAQGRTVPARPAEPAEPAQRGMSEAVSR